MRLATASSSHGNAHVMINVTNLLCGTSGGIRSERMGDAGDVSECKPAVVWNITRRCNLRCAHCYSDSAAKHYSGELTLGQMVEVIDDLSDCRVSGVVLSGGDPMFHPHFFDVAGYAIARGLRVAVSTNGTRIDSHAAQRLKDLGVASVGISLDGVGENHDRFRGRPGAFKRAVDAFRHCRGAGQKAALRIKLTRQTAGELPEILRFIEEEEIPQVCFYHLVYSGRGSESSVLPAAETRQALRMIADAVLRWGREGSNTEVLTVDQPVDGVFFWLTMRRRNPKRTEEIWRLLKCHVGGRNTAGPWVASIDCQGNVHPARFCPGHTLGNVKEQPFSEIWKNGQYDALLSGFRGRLPRLKGRCVECRFQDVCGGGFRARPFQKYGDPLAEDPGCYLRDYEIAGAGPVGSMP